MILHVTASDVFTSLWGAYIVYTVYNVFLYTTEDSVSSYFTVRGESFTHSHIQVALDI